MSRFDGLPSMQFHETPAPEGLRPSQLPPVPESVRKAREATTQTRLRLDRILESAKRLWAEEPLPDTQRSPGSPAHASPTWDDITEVTPTPKAVRS